MLLSYAYSNTKASSLIQPNLPENTKSILHNHASYVWADCICIQSDTEKSQYSASIAVTVCWIK